jgi:hypothetical protein
MLVRDVQAQWTLDGVAPINGDREECTLGHVVREQMNRTSRREISPSRTAKRYAFKCKHLPDIRNGKRPRRWSRALETVDP